MSLEQKRSKRIDHKETTINYWKWGFFTLVFIFIVLIFFLVNALQPVNTTSKVTETVREEEMLTLTTSMPTEDVEWLANTYLSQVMGEDFSSFLVVFSDYLEIHGEIEFLSFDIPFALYFEPYVLENGNVQLRGDSVELSNISLPVSTVMRLMGNQLNLPYFLSIDSEQQIIVVDLQTLSKDYTFDLALTSINLEVNEIEFNLYLEEESVYDNLKYLQGLDQTQ